MSVSIKSSDDTLFDISEGVNEVSDGVVRVVQDGNVLGNVVSVASIIAGLVFLWMSGTIYTHIHNNDYPRTIGVKRGTDVVQMAVVLIGAVLLVSSGMFHFAGV